MISQTVDVNLLTSTHPDIAKRISLVGLMYSIVMLLAGIFFFVLDFELITKSTSVSMLLMLFGTVLVLYGVYRIFWRSRELVYLPTGSIVREYNLFFDLQYLNTITDMLNNGQLSNVALKNQSSGNIRLDIMLARDHKFAAVQLFQFVPYCYTPVTQVYYFRGTEASAVATFLLKSRN